MITLETLKKYLEKIEDAEKQVINARSEKFQQIKQLEEDRVALREQLLIVTGQMIAIEELMNIENHNVELPFAGDEIEEMHMSRLVGQGGMSAEEVRRFREDKAYSRESLGVVEQIDEANKAAEAEEGDPSLDIP